MMDKLPIPFFIARDDNLANGRGMTNCELVGISGGCGLDCPVLLAGERVLLVRSGLDFVITVGSKKWVTGDNIEASYILNSIQTRVK